MKEETALQSLVEKARAGDRAAFDEILRRHRERVLGVIRERLGPALRGRTEAEDVFQESALRAFKAVGRFEWQGEDSFFRWLSGIAVRVIFEAASREGRDRTVDLGSRADFPASGPTASQGLRREERRQRLEEALWTLPEEHRRVLVLAWVDGLSIKEIAERVGKSPGAVSQMVLRGLRRLRETFGDTESLGLPRSPFAEESEKP